MTDLMNYNDFLEEVRDYFEDKYKNAYVDICKVTKNNGVIYTGICIRFKNESIAPTVYLDDFYNQLCKDVSLEEILSRIDMVWSSRRLGNDARFDSFKDYNTVRNGLRCKLINCESNEEYLLKVPHREFLDLAIVPYYLVCDNEIEGLNDECASIVIRHEHLKLWNVDEEEILETAIENTMDMEESEIITMAQMLKQLKPDTFGEVEVRAEDIPMYIMSNKGCNGAVAMLDEEKLTDFCNSIESDVYIIPSSIREVLLIPQETNCDETYLNEMVREVNDTQLNPTEVLADHVYYFSRTGGYREREAV